MKMATLNCEKCGKEFTTREVFLRFRKVKYCSKLCQTAARTTRFIVNCQTCGKEFFAIKSNVAIGKDKFCSRKCHDKSRKMDDITCQVCGKIFTKKPHYKKTVFCSRACSGFSRRGDKHPMHVEGHPVKNYGDSWQTQRKAAIDRDGHRCVVCGKHEKELTKKTLHVHHKIRRRFFTNEITANDLSNLVTLCIACHRKAEDGRITL